jgi:hypothetical protein
MEFTNMKNVARILLLSMIVLTAAVITITACGGNRPGGNGGGSALRAFIFNSNPLGFHVTKGFGTARASIAPFTVNAQATTPGGGNFPGFCDTHTGGVARTVTVIYGLGRWSSGSCDDRSTSDSDVGVAIPQNGQIGNLTVDARGTGTVADNGTIGINGAGSGQSEVIIIHTDGTRTQAPLTCTLGVSAVDAKDHCEDKTPAHHIDVVAGDQVISKFWVNPGDAYRAIRVNIEFATPTF